jgi:hypothetical protein
MHGPGPTRKHACRVMGYVDFMDGRQAENARAAFDGWAGFGEPLQVTHNYAHDAAYKRPRDDYGGKCLPPLPLQMRPVLIVCVLLLRADAALLCEPCPARFSTVAGVQMPPAALLLRAELTTPTPSTQSDLHVVCPFDCAPRAATDVQVLLLCSSAAWSTLWSTCPQRASSGRGSTAC